MTTLAIKKPRRRGVKNGSSDYISLAAYHNDTVNRDLTGAISIMEAI